MLLRLCIRNYILIESLTLDFTKGLTVITGETGSGKSIIIDALMILFGTKVSKNIIRDTAQKLIFEAEFMLNNDASIKWLENNDLINEDNQNILICKRVIDNYNKSKIYINGYASTNLQIKQLGEIILDIYTQHASITLLKNDVQRQLLDNYAGIDKEVIKLTGIYKNIISLKDKKAIMQKQLEQTNKRKEYLNAIIEDLDELDIKEQQWNDLNTRHKELVNSSLILTELNNATMIVQNNDNSIIKQLNYINNKISKLPLDQLKINQLLQLIEEATIELNELDYLIESIANTISQDSDESEQIEKKISSIFEKARKYKVAPENLFNYITQHKLELASCCDNTDLKSLDQQLTNEINLYASLAQIITDKRTKYAHVLSVNITKSLGDLAINGEFKVALTTNNLPSMYGNENIEYMISYNKGIALQPLAKVASGGELSRTALALYLLLSSHNPPDIIIFDEIDVAISGKVTSFIGEMLAMLGKTKQIICITHQPQTASYAENHLVVSKHSSNNKTITAINYVTEQERIDEIARMLGGVVITDTTLSHAQEMLQTVKQKLL